MSATPKLSPFNTQKLKKQLEESGLHQFGLMLSKFDQLPWFVLLIFGGVLAVMIGFPWHILSDGRFTFWVLYGFGVVLLGDALLLMSLPRLRISFGPWKSQFLQLALLRMMAATAVTLAGLFLPLNVVFWAFVATQLFGSAAFFYGAVIETHRLELTHLNIKTDRLPAETRPIRILQISDLHIEYLTKREARVLELAAEARPDIIVITGDYPNVTYQKDPKTLEQIRELLLKLEAPFGVFAVKGTPGVDLHRVIPPLFESLPIPLLRNEWRTLDFGGGAKIALLGMDCTHEIAYDTAVLDTLMAKAPPNAVQILLYHSPELMPQVSERDFDLYLCGHTHGGQVRLPFYGAILTSSQLGKRYVMGHYQHGRTHLYISRGIGLEGQSAPRVRFLCPPEMTLVTVESAVPKGRA